MSLMDCLAALGMIVGMFAGAVYGWENYGLLGLAIGLAGGVLGLLGGIAFSLLMAFSLIGVLAVWAFIKGGSKGFREFLREAPSAWRNTDPPAPPTSAGE